MRVDLKLLEMLFAKTAGRVKYGLGKKAPSLDADSSVLTRIDCSGFVRWLLYRASSSKLALPDGSWYQKRWCEKNLRRLEQYADVHYAAQDPSRLFIAFIEPGAIYKGSVGHVWLVREGVTRESHAGKGVNSRAWDSPTLRAFATAAYEVPTG